MAVLKAKVEGQDGGICFETLDFYNWACQPLKESGLWEVKNINFEFVDGTPIERELFEAIVVNEASLERYFETLQWALKDQEKFIIAVTEGGYHIDHDPDSDGVEIFYVENYYDIAEQAIENGLYGEVDETLKSYIDYYKLGKHLALNYSRKRIAGRIIFYKFN